MLKFIQAPLLFASMLAIFAMPSIAWESEKPVFLPSPNGSIPQGLTVKKVAIAVQGPTVTLTYAISNQDDKSRANIFAIYLQPFAWSGVASDYPDQHFPEFRVFSDQRQVRLGKTEIALHDGRDITRDLIRAGLRPTRVGLGEDALLETDELHRGKYLALVQSGALKPVDGVYMPKWQAQVSYWWKQEYKPHKDTRIDLQYTARPGFFPISKTDKRLASYILAHCGSEKDVEELTSDRLFKGKDHLMVKIFLLPFGLGDQPLDEATLVYSPGTKADVSGTAVSYVCTDTQGSGAKGTPSLQNVKVSNPDRIISVLTISGMGE